MGALLSLPATGTDVIDTSAISPMFPPNRSTGCKCFYTQSQWYCLHLHMFAHWLHHTLCLFQNMMSLADYWLLSAYVITLLFGTPICAVIVTDWPSIWPWSVLVWQLQVLLRLTSCHFKKDVSIYNSCLVGPKCRTWQFSPRLMLATNFGECFVKI